MTIAEYEKMAKGLTFDTMGQEIKNYNIKNACLMFFFFFIITTMTGIYLTQVMPHAAGGFREHPLYCFGFRIQKARKSLKKQADNDDN